MNSAAAPPWTTYKLYSYLFPLMMLAVAPPPLAAQLPPKHYDLLITNTTIVDVINKQVLPHKSIAVKNGRIEAILDSRKRPAAHKVIDGSSSVALPGFVNTHTHLWQHICKGCAPNQSLQEWTRIYRAIHYLDEQQLYRVVLAAAGEALLSGITTVSDYASLGFNDYGFKANARALKDAGLGGVLIWHNPSIFLPDRIKRQEIPRLQAAYKGHFSLWMGQGPLSFHSLPQVYSGIRLANDLQMNLSEHTMENNEEQRDLYDRLNTYVSRYRSQLRPADLAFLEKVLATRKPSGVAAYEEMTRNAERILAVDDLLRGDSTYTPLSPEERQQLTTFSARRSISPLVILQYLNTLRDFLSIHSVWPEKEDLSLMQQYSVTISHNPESNMYLSSGIAPVHEYLSNGLLVSLGTDGAASNDRIDFFSAMRAMWNLQKIRALNPLISGNQDAWGVLQAATINGARALKLDTLTGSIQVGREADIILLARDKLGMAPIRDNIPVLAIYSASPADIQYVFSNGELVVEKGKLLKARESALAGNLTQIAHTVDQQISNGKLWSASYALTPQELTPYWYTYRSVRQADSIHLHFTNRSTQPMEVHIISSAAVFGGGSPHVVEDSVKMRFPEHPPSRSFSEIFSLMPGTHLQVVKPKNSHRYRLQAADRSVEKTSSNGQLLVLVEGRSGSGE